jgi:transposase
MFGTEKRVLAKHYLEQQLSQQAVAELLGISRRTSHRWIREGLPEGPPRGRRYAARPGRAGKLDPYKSTVEERLKAYPELSSVRLLEKIRAEGRCRRRPEAHRLRVGHSQP